MTAGPAPGDSTPDAGGEPLASAVIAWFEAAVGAAPPDPAAFARARGIDVAAFTARLGDARWLVARHEDAAATLRPQLPEPPCRIGDFELLAHAGRGGMGVVYQARQVSLQRIVAFKMLDPEHSEGSRGRRRFLHEARAAARLRHPNIVPVLVVGEADGLAWYALEWIDGPSLAQALHDAPAAPDPTRHRGSAALIAKVARALQHAHEQGLLHRDVKPSNILLDRAGEPHLSDFGLVKDLATMTLTASGELVGSPAYMSPEQLEDPRHLTVRSDVYSLGVTLYECLTRRRPHDATSVALLRRQLVSASCPRPRVLDPTVPAELEWICLRAIAPEPSRRYPSAAAMAADLESFLRGEPVRATPPSAWLTLSRLGRRHARALAAMAAAATVVALLALLWTAARERERARERQELWRELVDHRLWGEPAQLEATLARAVVHDAAEPAFRLLAILRDVRRRDPAEARAGIVRLRQVAPDMHMLALADQLDAALRRLRAETPLPDDATLLQSLAHAPDDDATRLWLRGEVLAVLQQWSACAERLLAAREIDPSIAPRLVPTLVAACHRLGRVTQAHDEMLAFARTSNRPDAWADAVRLATVAGDATAARQHLAEMRGRFATSVWVDYAELSALRPGECTAAELEARHERARGRGGPDWPRVQNDFHKLLANLYRDSGAVNRSIDLWRTLVARDPGNSDLRGLLGSAMHQQGVEANDPQLRDEGLEQLRLAAVAADQHLLARDVAWGTYFHFAGDPVQAVAHFREAARLMPEHPRVWRSLAGACRQQAQAATDRAERLRALHEGVAAQQREVDLGREDPRAWTLMVLQLQELQRCMEEDGAHEEVVEVLAQLQHARGQLQRLQRRQASPATTTRSSR